MRTRASAALVVLLAGCSLPYVAHVSYGQARILIGRISIESRLEDPSVSEAEKAKLRLVLDVKKYAKEEIGLAASSSYESVYDTEGDPVAWNLSACDDDAFLPYTWDFPIMGVMPYKGYFYREPAVEEAREIKAAHKDVLLAPVSAYSTLGWFADPVYTPMIAYRDEELANVVFHELTHATIFIERDSEFNETLATFVGNQGAVDFFLAKGGKDDPRLASAARAASDDRVFQAQISALRAKLDAVYKADLPREEKLREKAKIFGDFETDFATKVAPTLETDHYGFVATHELNNAWILALARYHGDLEVFAKVHAKLGSRLKATVEKLKEIARSDDPRRALNDFVKD